MTVQATTRVKRFDGNDLATEFSFSFKTFARTDLEVVLTGSDGNDTTLTLDSHYSVALNVDQDSSPGGTITYPVSGDPLATGEKLTVIGSLEAKQETNLANAGGFFAQTHENAFDKLTILVQEIKEKIARAVLAAPSDDDPVLSLGTATQRAGKFPSFDDNGNIEFAQSLPSGTLSESSIGGFLNPQSDAEVAAGVSPLNVAFSEEYIRVKRYATAGTAFEGSQDDAAAHTAAARAALAVAAEYGGAKIVFEHGHYVLDTCEIDRGDMEIIGDGADISASTDIPAGGAIFLSLSGGDSTTTNQALLDGIYGAGVHSVRTVEPNGLLNNRVSGLRLLPGFNVNAIKAIWLTGWHIGTVLENITAYGFTDAGIAMNGCFSFEVRNCDLRGSGGSGVGLELAKAGNGIFGASAVQCNAINLNGVQSGRDCDIGFRWGEGLGGIITGCTWQDNTVTAAAVIQDCIGFSYVGNYHELSSGAGLVLGTDAAEPFSEGVVNGNFFQLSTGSVGGIQLLSARRSVIGPNRFAGPVSIQYITPAAYVTSQLVGNRIFVSEDSGVYIDESAGGVIDRSQLIQYSVLNDPLRGFHNFPSVRMHKRVCKPLVTAAEITAATVNDYNPGTTATAVRLTADSSVQITGIISGEDGRELELHNVGTFTITLRDQVDTGSAPANRIILPTGSNLAIATGRSATLRYDSTSQRWRVVGTTGVFS